MTPEDQAFDLINAGLNAITEQLKRVNQALQELVLTLAEREAENKSVSRAEEDRHIKEMKREKRHNDFIESRAEEAYYKTGKWPKE